MRTNRNSGQQRAEKTRRRVLAAALDEFARLGLAGARVDKIVARARANKQAVYYYFGSKDDLYRASLAMAYGEFQPDARWQKAGVPAERAMRELVAAIFEHMKVNQKASSIISLENQYHGSHLTPALRKQIQKSVAPIISALSDVLRRGQAEGVFSRKVRPVHLYLSTICLCMFYFSNRYTLSAILGRDLGTARSTSAWGRHVVEFVLASLRAG
jgi:TetR/AcrR family transcriptional regulator